MTASSPSCRLDHIVVTAPELARGVDYVSDALGVPVERGGEHVRMATHNALLRLGDRTYLEVIAPDPGAPPPGRPRWFGLDALGPGAAPRLAAWVARSSDVHAAARAAAEPLGEIVEQTRAALRWSITVPGDGGLVLGGAAPMILEWHTGGEVASRLTDVGCALVALELRHPDPDRVDALLRSIGCDDDAIVVASLRAGQRPYLVAHLETPSGPLLLGGPPR